MAYSIGNEIPAELRPLLFGLDRQAQEGLTFLLLTTMPEGWPHLAMLSVGELLATDARSIRMALWRNSTASRNVTASGRCTLALVHANAGYSLRCVAARGPDLEVEGAGLLAYFGLRVEDIQKDEAPYAWLTSGVTFELKDPDDVLPRWRRTLEELAMAPALDVAG